MTGMPIANLQRLIPFAVMITALGLTGCVYVPGRMGSYPYASHASRTYTNQDAIRDVCRENSGKYVQPDVAYAECIAEYGQQATLPDGRVIPANTPMEHNLALRGAEPPPPASKSYDYTGVMKAILEEAQKCQQSAACRQRAAQQQATPTSQPSPGITIDDPFYAAPGTTPYCANLSGC